MDRVTKITFLTIFVAAVITFKDVDIIDIIGRLPAHTLFLVGMMVVSYAYLIVWCARQYSRRMKKQKREQGEGS